MLTYDPYFLKFFSFNFGVNEKNDLENIAAKVEVVVAS
jgi:hypothetical protein